jgi:hypothetical protein
MLTRNALVATSLAKAQVLRSESVTPLNKAWDRLGLSRTLGRTCSQLPDFDASQLR